MDHPRLAWRRRLAAYLDRPWPVVPAQPILYLFIVVGAVHVAVTPTNVRLGFDAAGFSTNWYAGWTVLMIAGPLMVASAWLLIRHGSGRSRVAGFWLRAGGDVGVFTGMAAYLTARILLLHDSIADSPLFALITLTGLTTFTFALVVRDTAALILLERTTTRLHRIDDL